ncbi:hypothetical protein GCM10020254_39480 [Streptomyces goshikiensis]
MASVPTPRFGAGEARVAGGGAVAAELAAHQAAADAEEAARAGFLRGQGVRPGPLGGGLREGLELLGVALDVVALEVGEHHLGLGDAVVAEHVAVRADHGDGPEVAEADAGEAQAAGGDQQLLRLVLPGQQGEGEQSGLAVGQLDHARGQAALAGQFGAVDGGQREVLAAGGEQPARGDLDDGRAAPLLVDAADAVEDGVRGDGLPGREQGGDPVEVGDALVERGAQRDRTVLGEVLLRGEHGRGQLVLADAAQAQGREPGEGQQQYRQHGDRRSDPAEQ